MNRIKGIKYFVLLFLLFFVNNIDVYAAKTLTCVYEYQVEKFWFFKTGTVDKVILTQDADGNRKVYTNPKDVGMEDKNWTILSGDAYNFFSKGSRTELASEDAIINFDSNGDLTSCPPSKETYGSGESTTIWFFGDKSGSQQLINHYDEVKKPTLGNDEIKELTCVYKMDGNSPKIAITQNKDGLIEMYENEYDVAIDDTKNYWTKSESLVPILDYSITQNGKYLTECPKTKTNGLINVTFYANNTGQEGLETPYDGVMNIQTRVNSSASDNLNYNIEKFKKSCSQVGDVSNKWLKDHDGYTLSCLYEKTIDNFRGEGQACHIFQINIGNNGLRLYDSETEYYDDYNINSYAIDSAEITEDNVIANNAGECPTMLKVIRLETGYMHNGILGVNTTVKLTSASGDIYALVDGGVSGNNLVTGARASSDFSYNIDFNKVEIKNCDDLFGDSSEELKSLLKMIINIVKIIIPIILLVLGTLDFVQAIFASNEDGIKKAQGKFIKRLLIAVVIFLIPSVLKLILTLANSIWPAIDATLCGILD